MTKYAGHDATLQADFAGGTAYVTIAQVVDVNGPAISRNAIDVTTRDNTNYWRDFQRGFKDAGELTFTLLADTAQATHGTATGIMSDINNDTTTLAAWRVQLPDTGTWTFDGFVTGTDDAQPLDDAWTWDVTVKISGQPTLTTA